ncbi:MAG: hypothetical protein A2600_06550 [Candidatus Lambdaproteobacteria bacterium RIFOXYD1_FULL_56_27]|uniref:Uncharacterized protein n=1 Tax=Candidatus Lambdaproteobacteria bacterium RIFOXYD2_FULL_56_26 TaxID=1817773 RepID=A0A1F6H0E6_9PROT|nr:MAG: hypothetical protein A2426_05965 [Candidatus Lambdaproteobacteria bacterium RIFOXYC1_FULL_56_13]OGH03866.1 MAG: hypothetical protein A2557_12060 [Candidatus Lambdaproteobacteria bacterium RIFOXYD2_FULL_56_26]OGH08994.1 MAG: hypothetical protein A2600_06550 [Candidatus Lambdaproteobacteria bacterium RIFOXYD1_FULL_56_27]
MEKNGAHQRLGREDPLKRVASSLWSGKKRFGQAPKVRLGDAPRDFRVQKAQGGQRPPEGGLKGMDAQKRVRLPNSGAQEVASAPLDLNLNWIGVSVSPYCEENNCDPFFRRG